MIRLPFALRLLAAAVADLAELIVCVVAGVLAPESKEVE